MSSLTLLHCLIDGLVRHERLLLHGAHLLRGTSHIRFTLPFLPLACTPLYISLCSSLFNSLFSNRRLYSEALESKKIGSSFSFPVSVSFPFLFCFSSSFSFSFSFSFPFRFLLPLSFCFLLPFFCSSSPLSFSFVSASFPFSFSSFLFHCPFSFSGPLQLAIAASGPSLFLQNRHPRRSGGKNRCKLQASNIHMSKQWPPVETAEHC